MTIWLETHMPRLGLLRVFISVCYPQRKAAGMCVCVCVRIFVCLFRNFGWGRFCFLQQVVPVLWCLWGEKPGTIQRFQSERLLRIQGQLQTTGWPAGVQEWPTQPGSVSASASVLKVCMCAHAHFLFVCVCFLFVCVYVWFLFNLDFLIFL